MKTLLLILTITAMSLFTLNAFAEDATSTTIEHSPHQEVTSDISVSTGFALDVVGIYTLGAIAQPTMDLYLGSLYATLDAGIIGAYFDFRFRRTPFGGAYGTTWMEQGYATVKPMDMLTIIIGSFYNRFGLYATENTWWLSQNYYTGYAYDSDYGIGIDFNMPLGETMGISAHLGYMITDDGLNGIWNAGNPIVAENFAVSTGVLSTESYSEANTIVARGAYNGSFGPLSLDIGASVLTGGLAQDGTDASSTGQFVFDIDAVVGFSMEGAPGVKALFQYTSFNQDTANIFDAISGATFGEGSTLLFGLSVDLSSFIPLDTIDLHFQYSSLTHAGTSNSQLIIGAFFGIKNLLFTLEYVSYDPDTSSTAAAPTDVILLDTYVAF